MKSKLTLAPLSLIFQKNSLSLRNGEYTCRKLKRLEKRCYRKSKTLQISLRIWLDKVTQKIETLKLNLKL